MEREGTLAGDDIFDVHLDAIQKVAEAMHMTLEQFLTEEVRGITPAQARGFLKAFAVYSDDRNILTAYYLTRAATERSDK